MFTTLFAIIFINNNDAALMKYKNQCSSCDFYIFIFKNNNDLEMQNRAAFSLYHDTRNGWREKPGPAGGNNLATILSILSLRHIRYLQIMSLWNKKQSSFLCLFVYYTNDIGKYLSSFSKVLQLSELIIGMICAGFTIPNNLNIETL